MKPVSVSNSDNEYALERDALTLRFVSKKFDDAGQPPQFHSLYYDSARHCGSGRHSLFHTAKGHPLEGSAHNFLRAFHATYQIVQSLTPSLLPELTPAFVWDSRINNHATTQLPYELPAETTLNLGTYFNSFYISVIEQIIGKKSFHLFLEFKGKLHLEITAHTVHGQSEVLYNETLVRPTRGWALLPLPPVVASLQPHRVGVRLSTKRDKAYVHGMHFATPQIDNTKTPRFAILVRTFNRVTECKRLLATLAAHDCLQNSHVHLIVHDASHAFTETELGDICGNMRISLLHQDNYGSSGNLVILLDHLKKCYTPTELENTVAAILDDDVLVHPESLLRACFLAAHSLTGNTMIVGSFLDRCRPMNIDATVALYGDDLRRDTAMHLQPLRGGDRVDNPYYLDLSCQPVSGNTAAFYLLVARASLLTSTVPLPLFLKWDDIDYTASLHAKGAQLVAVPGICVWHDAFYDCMPVWQEVLNVKHGLIVDMVHLDHSWEAAFKSIRDIVFRHLVVFDYNTCEAMLEAVTDVLDGCLALSPSELLEASRVQISALVRQYAALQTTSTRLIPDARTLTHCLMSNQPCSLSDGTTAPVVHELFPAWSTGYSSVYVKHASAASRSMLLRYNSERHNTIIRQVVRLAAMENEFYGAREHWRSRSTALREEEHWSTILQRELA
jgi:GT2 family glycosyltransferase